MKRKTKSEKWEIVEYMEDDTPKKWFSDYNLSLLYKRTPSVYSNYTHIFNIHWNRAVSIKLSVCHFRQLRRRWCGIQKRKKTQIIIQYLDAANEFRLHGNCATIIFFCYFFRCHSLRTYTRDADAQQCRQQRQQQQQHTIRQANMINHLIN